VEFGVTDCQGQIPISGLCMYSWVHAEKSFPCRVHANLL